MERIKVLIADDHALIRRGLIEVLGMDDSIEVVGEASDGEEAMEKARELRPHLVLMDLSMPRCDGVEATHKLQAEMPETRVLILTVSDKGRDLVNAMKAGARGYILKNEEPETLIQAVQYVFHGGIMVSPLMATSLLEELKAERPPVGAQEEPSLNSREQEVLMLLAEGMSDKGIAGRLFTTENAIKTHVSNILHKLHVASRHQAVAYAYRSGVVDRRQKAYEQHGGIQESPDSETEPVSPPTTTEAIGGTVTGVVELVISPPLEPHVALRLHRWLKEVVNAETWDVTGSWGGDTVIKIGVRHPLPLVGMIKELPVVAEVTEEPYAGDIEVQVGSSKTGLRRTVSRRFRLVLKPS